MSDITYCRHSILRDWIWRSVNDLQLGRTSNSSNKSGSPLGVRANEIWLSFFVVCKCYQFGLVKSKRLQINPLSESKILALSKLKAFPDDKRNVMKNNWFLSSIMHKMLKSEKMMITSGVSSRQYAERVITIFLAFAHQKWHGKRFA